MKIKIPQSKQPLPKHAKRVFKGILFDVYQWPQKLFDGSTTIFEKIKRPGTVMVLPVTKDKKIILTEQEQPIEGKFLGALGGIVDWEEEILAGAKRELLEESGYKAKTWILWEAVQLINKIEWPTYVFIAKDLVKVQAMSPDPGEKIKLKPVSFDKFLSICASEKFRDIEISLRVLRAKQDSKKLKKMKELFLK
jgi:ADP-ribose pyrophosphatase